MDDRADKVLATMLKQAQKVKTNKDSSKEAVALAQSVQALHELLANDALLPRQWFKLS